MNPSAGGPRRSPGLEWIADLTFEHADRVAARLHADATGCVFEVVGRRGLRALVQLRLKRWLAKLPEGDLLRWAILMPGQISLSLSGVPIGHYEPAAPLSWWSRRMGLPFGRLSILKVAFVRAYLLGGR